MSDQVHEPVEDMDTLTEFQFSFLKQHPVLFEFRHCWNEAFDILV